MGARAIKFEPRPDEQLIAATRAAADPYAEFVRRREAEREADRLRSQIASNPVTAWENLRSWDPSQAA